MAATLLRLAAACDDTVSLQQRMNLVSVLSPEKLTPAAFSALYDATAAAVERARASSEINVAFTYAAAVLQILGTQGERGVT